MNNVCTYFTKWYSFVILRHATNEEKKIFRKIEKTSEKLTNAEQHVKFNEQCIQHDLLPKFTNIRLHNAEMGTQAFVKKFRRNLLLQESKKQEELVKSLREQLTYEKANLKAIVTELRYEAFILFLSRLRRANETTVQIRHHKKLCHLYESELPYLQEQSKVINLSNTDIPEEIKNILQLGMNYNLKSKFSEIEKKIEIEKLYDNIKLNEKYKKLSINNDEQLRCELKQFRSSSVQRLQQ